MESALTSDGDEGTAVVVCLYPCDFGDEIVFTSSPFAGSFLSWTWGGRKVVDISAEL